MRRPELDYILNTMMASQTEVSDLLFTVNRPLQVESFGELKPVVMDPPIEKLTPFQTEMVALNLVGDNPWNLYDLIRHGSCDAAYSLSDKARFRINIFSQRGNYSCVLRKLNTQIPTLEQLKLPPVFKEVAKEKTGLVLVTGATGSGKSTTLAALLAAALGDALLVHDEGHVVPDRGLERELLAEQRHEIARMQAVAHLPPAAVEAEIFQRALAFVGMNPE